jgi:hypothetical protein
LDKIVSDATRRHVAALSETQRKTDAIAKIQLAIETGKPLGSTMPRNQASLSPESKDSDSKIRATYDKAAKDVTKEVLTARMAELKKFEAERLALLPKTETALFNLLKETSKALTQTGAPAIDVPTVALFYKQRLHDSIQRATMKYTSKRLLAESKKKAEAKQEDNFRAELEANPEPAIRDYINREVEKRINEIVSTKNDDQPIKRNNPRRGRSNRPPVPSGSRNSRFSTASNPNSRSNSPNRSRERSRSNNRRTATPHRKQRTPRATPQQQNNNSDPHSEWITPRRRSNSRNRPQSRGPGRGRGRGTPRNVRGRGRGRGHAPAHGQ